MAELLRMPEVAAGAESAVLSSWPLAEGASYSSGDVIAVIETDKAVVDFEAETDGVLLRPLVTAGTEVAIGDPIAIVTLPGEAIADIDAVIASLMGAPLSGQQEGPDSPTIEAGPSQDVAGAPMGAERRIFASPLARRMARERGIDLATLSGSGPQGRIRRADVESASAAAAVAPPAMPSPASPAPAAAQAPTASEGIPVPHSRLRRAIATRLVQSKQQAPHFYLRGSARVDRLSDLRADLNGEEGQRRVSMTDLLLRAMALAMAQVPDANVLWTEDALVRHAQVDIGLAVATDTGLVTPVVRAVDRMTVREIAAVTQDLATRARSGSLRQHELEGGVTTLTNLGMYGTEDFDAIINPPQSSILAAGAARQVPLVSNGSITVGTSMRFSLSVDHRPIDGAIAARWMASFVDLLEHPGRLLI